MLPEVNKAKGEQKPPIILCSLSNNDSLLLHKQTWIFSSTAEPGCCWLLPLLLHDVCMTYEKNTWSLKLRGINPLFCMISALRCRVECTRLLHIHPPQWTWPQRNRENVKAKESSICKEQPWGQDYSHYTYLFIGFLTTPPQHPFVFQYLWPCLTTQTRWCRESKQMTTCSGSWSKQIHSRSFGLNSSGMKKAFGE